MGIYSDNAVVNTILWLATGIQVAKGIHARGSVLACATEIRKSPERLKTPGVRRGYGRRSDRDTVTDRVGEERPGSHHR